MARKMHPGQRNSLDALARRYEVDNSKRELHGALLDAQILAEVYLGMTGGQVSLSLDGDSNEADAEDAAALRIQRDSLELLVLTANADELEAHEAMLARIRERNSVATLY
jgi:DNA polymerase-3 subunit epsilon